MHLCVLLLLLHLEHLTCLYKREIDHEYPCDTWARLESHGHGLQKTGWQGRPDEEGDRWQWTLYCWEKEGWVMPFNTSHKHRGETQTTMTIEEDHHLLQKWTKSASNDILQVDFCNAVFVKFCLWWFSNTGYVFIYLPIMQMWDVDHHFPVHFIKLNHRVDVNHSTTDVLLPPSEDLAKVHGE